MKLPKDALDNNTNSHAAVISSFMGITNLPRNEHEVDFSEYEWMGQEMEEFDKKCLEELWEEEFLEAMFDDVQSMEEEVGWLLDGLDHQVRIQLVRELHQLCELESEESILSEFYVQVDYYDRMREHRSGRDLHSPALVRNDSSSSLSSFLDTDTEEDR